MSPSTHHDGFVAATCVAAVAACVLLCVISAAEGQPAVRPIELGPAIGSQIPDFQAPDQDGRIRALDSLRGPKGTMLLFFRSADW